MDYLRIIRPDQLFYVISDLLYKNCFAFTDILDRKSRLGLWRYDFWVFWILCSMSQTRKIDCLDYGPNLIQQISLKPNQIYIIRWSENGKFDFS